MPNKCLIKIPVNSRYGAVNNGNESLKKQMTGKLPYLCVLCFSAWGYTLPNNQ